jgi:hypothetical protein
MAEFYCVNSSLLAGTVSDSLLNNFLNKIFIDDHFFTKEGK